MSTIAILGAGVAGLTLAQELSENHQVDVFEKSRGRGGRTAHKRTDWGNFDIGAQYFTARSTTFKHQVEQWLSCKVVKEWDFTPLKLEQRNNRSLLVASPDHTRRYIGTPGMNSITHHLSEGINIIFNTRIEKIEPIPQSSTSKHHCLELFDDAGVTHGQYDCVITAMPAEQTKQLLPDKTSYKNQIPENLHTPCWAVGIKTPKKIAPEIQGIFGDDTVSWVSRQSAKSKMEETNKSNKCDLWMLHFSPVWSAKNINVSRSEVFTRAKNWFHNAFHVPVDEQEYLVHFWRYANLSDNSIQQVYYDQQLKIGSIGDWTSGGRIEGAFNSAHALINSTVFKL